MTPNEALLQISYNEPAWCFGAGATRVAVTRQGGMMAPVTFFADSDRPVQPYLINPWWDEGVDAGTPSLLATLRGDFFCAPFGGNETPFEGQQYPPHGESPNKAWELEDFRASAAGAVLQCRQGQTVRPGLIRKFVAVRAGESVVYQRHDMIGLSGPMCFGYHPCLHVPDEAGQGYLAFAPHRYAHTYIAPMEVPEKKGYSLLKPDTRIDDLTRCPTITGETTDLTRYPSRRGYEDLVMLSAAEGLAFGWTAYSLPQLGYVWFSLKNPRVLVSTVLWLSNGGRHFPPWNGRNVNTIGLEEVTSFFHEGLASSAKKNFINERGIPTSFILSEREPLVAPIIQGVARIPPGFTGVSAIEAVDEETVRLTSVEGSSVLVKACLSFLEEGKIKELID